MDKPNLPKLGDYLNFLNQLERDKQVPAKAMIPFLVRAFLELSIEEAWQVLAYWQRNDENTNR